MRYNLFFGLLFFLGSATGQRGVLVNNPTEPKTAEVPMEYSIKALEDINTSHQEFNAINWQEGILFTSNREPNRPNVCADEFGNYYTDVYFAKRGDTKGSFASIREIEGGINKKFNDGAVTVAPSQRRIYFSRNDRRFKNTSKTHLQQIFQADLEDGIWSKVQPVEELNSTEFTSLHPALSRDGSIMVFASNRPGGLGGTDLYVTRWNGAQWTAPRNLGAEINTPGNEVFPFLGPDGILYFSSTGHPGRGGLDVFKASGLSGNWQNPINLGEPINSAFDDLSFNVNYDNKTGYFASNRPGGKGLDDIYSWTYQGLEEAPVEILITDDTQMRLKGAEINIYKNGAKDVTLYANSNGTTGYSVKAGDQLRIEVTKEGYQPNIQTVSAEELRELQPYKIMLGAPIEKTKSTLEGTVTSLASGALLPGTTLLVKDNCTGKVREYLTDKDGNFAIEVDCKCTYEVTAQRNNYEQQQSELSSSRISCDDKTKLNIAMPAKKIVAPTPPPAPAPVKDPVLGSRDDMRVGAVISLDNLYYDFNKATIRNDAAYELDNVVNLLRQYPSMEIELGSHTDSRGTAAYNQALSQRRAESAVNYIISRGIRSSRIRAVGYGESQPTNGCSDGVDCSEEEHQANRRTVITITRLDNKEVRVEYGN